MRILYVTNGINGAGGLERVLSVKASHLADRLGYEIHILTLNATPAPLFYDFSPKIKFHNIVALGNPVAYLKKYGEGLRKVAKQVSPDINSVCEDGLKGFFVHEILGKE